MPLILKLSVGWLGARDMVLKSDGHTVVAAPPIQEANGLSMQEAADRLLAGDFDLLLLNYDFPPSKSGAPDQFNSGD